MKKLFLTVISTFICLAATAQANENNIAYKSGEKAEFAVSFRAKLWPDTEMARLTVEVKNDVVNDIPTYRIDAYARTTKFRWVYKMDDYYTTWMDKRTMRPVKATSELSQGNYRYSSVYDYDWDRMVVEMWWHKHHKPEPETRTLAVTVNARDLISMIYSLRSPDLKNMKPGEERTVELITPDAIRMINYRFIGRETKNVPGLGELRTMKFKGQIVTNEGEEFEDGNELTVWMSDDRNSIPVFLDSPIRWGSMSARLVSYKGLKYQDGVLK